MHSSTQVLSTKHLQRIVIGGGRIVKLQGRPIGHNTDWNSQTHQYEASQPNKNVAAGENQTYAVHLCCTVFLQGNMLHTCIRLAYDLRFVVQYIWLIFLWRQWDMTYIWLEGISLGPNSEWRRLQLLSSSPGNTRP